MDADKDDDGDMLELTTFAILRDDELLELFEHSEPEGIDKPSLSCFIFNPEKLVFELCPDEDDADEAEEASLAATTDAALSPSLVSTDKSRFSSLTE